METREQVRLDALVLNDDDRAALAEELLESLFHRGDEPSDLEQVLAERSAASRAGRVKYRDPLEIMEIYAQMKAERAGRAS
jgi:hypothetical protein